MIEVFFFVDAERETMDIAFKPIEVLRTEDVELMIDESP